MSDISAATRDLEALVAQIEHHLQADLPAELPLAPRFIEALQYAALGGGKRLRPALLCATAMSLGAPLESALTPAIALEYVHTYSLVHDDLPSMDDDELRRGRPTTHVEFDEATAILVGDALQTLAFERLANAPELNAETKIGLVGLLSTAAGWENMIAGQALDMAGTGEHALSLEEIHSLHAAKTGAMFRAAIQMGCVVAGVSAGPTFDAMTRFAELIGLAFQVVDDILDVTQTTEQLGKPAGSDERAGKSTFPALLGLNESRAYAFDLLASAQEELSSVGADGSMLGVLAQRTVERAF